jgi:amino acid transporter
MASTRARRRVELRRKLNTFDVTSLVVGSIIGADIYVAAALGARLVGPASLVVWFGAGLMAVVIALSFSHCATLLPRVGGPYAYVREVKGSFAGFAVGWGLFLAEWFSLAVFPVAFVQYADSLVGGISWEVGVLIKALFILAIFVTNYFGIRSAGRFNDVLTISKLAPLLMLVLAGLAFMSVNTGLVSSNFSPFSKGSVLDFGQALVLIFWAYAGFELSTLPATEIEKPERTIPKAIVTGMLVVTAFYLLTNFVIVGVVDQQSLSGSTSPLIDASKTIFSSVGSLAGIIPVVVGLGALISILGADESGTIGTSRLAFAMSVDGLFPRAFSRLHGRFRTPHLGLAIICTTAFVASVFGGLTQLISASVFLLAFAYLATSLSTILLERKYKEQSSALKGKLSIPIAGAAFSVLLMVFVGPKLILLSVGLLALGIPIYVLFATKQEVRDLKEAFLSREAVLRRTWEQGERFLAYPWRRATWLAYRLRRTKRPWVVQPSSGIVEDNRLH